MTTKQTVTPWVVEGDVDYEKLVKEFGTEIIDQELISRMERITGQPIHPWIRRGIFFSHRKLNEFLDAYERGDPVFLYTGRGPTSESMHIGHLIPFMMTQWLQKVFDCPLVIQISDDEKFYFKSLEFDEVHRLGFANARDIIACGFNPEKTFIFSNRDYRLKVKEFEIFVSTMKKYISVGTVRKIFGFDNETLNIGCYDWPFYQSAVAFSRAFPHLFGDRPAHCLVAYAIDQDPYFRMARDLATKMKLIKPYSIMSTFIPPLTSGGKMSSSVGTDATIFLTDSPEIIEKKIMTYAFSGGGGDGTLSDHKKYGGNIQKDIPYQYLRYFEFDDNELSIIRDAFTKGEMSCVEIKQLMAHKLEAVVSHHITEKEKVTQAVIDDFYSYKPMKLRQPPPQVLTPSEQQLYQILDNLQIAHTTRYHPIITSIEACEKLSSTMEGILCKALLLISEKGYHLYLSEVSVRANLSEVKKTLGVSKLKIADKSVLHDILKGGATVFSLINHPSSSKMTSVIIDQSVSTSLKVNFNPLREDATTTIKYGDMIKFLNHQGVTITIM